MSTLGAILVGGKSTRMGSDKASVDVGGRSMVERVADAVAVAADRVVLLGGPRQGFENWEDTYGGEGPLAGIATALARTDSPRVLIVAVDHAFVRAETLTALIATPSDLAVVPVDAEGIRQVTCAVYPASIAGQAAEEARSGGSVQSLLDRVAFEPIPPTVWERWGEDGRSWFSVDRPGAIEEGLRLFGR